MLLRLFAMIMLFSVELGWLPSTGRGPTTLLAGIPVSFLSADGLRHLLLPAFNLALFQLALLIRARKPQANRSWRKGAMQPMPRLRSCSR